MDREAAARAIDAFLIAIGRDPKTETEIRGTGTRVADAFIDELCSGYGVDVDALLSGNLIAGGGGIVELRDVAVTTTCPHHLMAGMGKATIGFAPKEKIIGVGALARLLEAFTRRLTLQESIGEGVVAAIEKNLSPQWVACRVEMSHACMIARGERTHGARLVTYALRGADDAARAEAMHFVTIGAAMIAVVTGAGRGIGRAISIELARRGADVALLSHTLPDETAALVKENGKRALAIECDVSIASDVAKSTKRVLEELGAPDVVIANAGIVRRALVTEMDETDWDAVIDVNLKGTFLTARAFVPSMIEKNRGRFVAIGSISSTLGTARQSAYCAAKWGVVGFVKSLAEEVRASGVQAMCVLPGSVDTEMLAGSGFAPKMTAEHVAKVVAFAALDAPDAMNGSAVEMFGA